MAAFTVIDHQERGASSWSPSGNTTLTAWSKTGIPTDGTYDHLLLVASIRSEVAIEFDIIDMRFNSITTNVYSSTDIAASTVTPTTTRTAARGDVNGAVWPGANATAKTFGCLKIWLPHYANTTNFKQVFMSSTSGPDSNADTEWALRLASGLWAQTAAVDEIELRSGYAGNHAQFSTFTLYGLKGA